MSTFGKLINNGNYVQYNEVSPTTRLTQEYCWLVFRHANKLNVTLLIHTAQYNCFNTWMLLVNAFPMNLIVLFLVLLFCIPADCVSHAISVVHECTNTCKYVSSSSSQRIEHEDVSISQLLYKHDYSNKMYCLNVYILYSIYHVKFLLIILQWECCMKQLLLLQLYM